MKPVVLTFTAHYLPGYKAGGPIRTIASMVDQLGDDFDFHIVTSDRDFGDNTPFLGVKTNQWTCHGKAQVFYGTTGRGAWQALRDTLATRQVDLVYLNSMFSFRAALWPLLQFRFGRLKHVPILLAPRGELNLGALGIKPFKKTVFLNLARATGLFRRVVFQASSVLEAGDIQRQFPDSHVIVARNLSNRSVAPPDVMPTCGANRALRAVFLSRVSPKKNLLTALKILKSVSTPIDFDIFGILEDKEYWRNCEAFIESLPSHIQVRFKGELNPDEVECTLAAYDLFFFPTLGENYGHVIREALSAGLPVLTSDQTPWGDLEVRNAGIALPLNDPAAFVYWLEVFAQLSASQRRAMRDAARAYGNDDERAAKDREDNRTMLRAVIRTDETIE